MKTSREKFLSNDWCIINEDYEDIYAGKYIGDEYATFYFKKSTNEIFCVEASSKYLSPDFIEELNEELKKLEVKENEN